VTEWSETCPLGSHTVTDYPASDTAPSRTWRPSRP